MPGPTAKSVYLSASLIEAALFKLESPHVCVHSSSILFHALVGLSFAFYEYIIVLLREISFFALQSHSLYAT